MTTDWAFLDPWRVALSAYVTQDEPANSDREMLVLFKWRATTFSNHKLTLMLRLEEGNPQNVSQLNQIREAIELFIVLSVSDNKTFTEQFSHMTQSMEDGERGWYPEWKLHVTGAATVQQDTWSRLLRDFSPSPQFQRAMQTLRTMRQNEMSKKNSYYRTHLSWKCKFDGGDVAAYLQFGDCDKIETNLRGMFNAAVSMMMNFVLTHGNTTLVDIWQHPYVPRNVNAVVSLRNLATPISRDLAAGLVYTPINSLSIHLSEENISNSFVATINTGVLLSRIYQWSQVISRKTSVSCFKLSSSVFAAICSAIAVQSTTTPINFTVQPVSHDSFPWSWLAYAVACSPTVEISMTVHHTALTKVDIWNIEDTLRYNYPLSKRSGHARSYQASEFGFVDIEEGTTIWPIGFEEGASFVVPSRVRCRAWFKEDYLEVVLPGLGLCQCRIGDGVHEVSHDSEEQKAPAIRSLQALSVHFTTIESVSSVMDLLKSIGGNLRSSKLGIQDYNNEVTLDLSVLSAICPQLGSLETFNFDLVVSTYNEALYLWPIKTLEIRDSRKFRDLILCLRNLKVLMTRELEKLELEFRYVEYDEKEVMELMAHDGDVLAVTMEKFPLHLKTALVSVANGDNNTIGVPHLHTDILELIFIFAGIPVRRSVSMFSQEDF